MYELSLRSLSAVILSIVLSVQLHSQECPCCGPEYGLFDFWIGDWTVYDSLDQEVGKNLIVKGQQGCLMEENWTSARNNTGSSYNYYLRSDSTWNQVWVDAQGGVLELKGGFDGKAMVLVSEKLSGPDGGYFYHRITWEPVQDEVIQTWEILDESFEVKNLLFKGFYRKSGS